MLGDLLFSCFNKPETQTGTQGSKSLPENLYSGILSPGEKKSIHHSQVWRLPRDHQGRLLLLQINLSCMIYGRKYIGIPRLDGWRVRMDFTEIVLVWEIELNWFRIRIFGNLELCIEMPGSISHVVSYQFPRYLFMLEDGWRLIRMIMLAWMQLGSIVN